ncbi:MAG: hypothetical protein O9353_02165, partial [Bacteroidia bacterium]|nr:hypothetical protein [Bacteroidia bacterium]
MQWTDYIVAYENTLKTISRKSERDTRTFSLSYSDKIIGENIDNKTGKIKPVKLSITASNT